MVIRSEVLQVPVKFTVKWNETTCANKSRPDEAEWNGMDNVSANNIYRTLNCVHLQPNPNILITFESESINP